MNQVPDIGEMLKFWELKDEITEELVMLSRYRARSIDVNYALEKGMILFDKIESLGKKEGE